MVRLAVLATILAATSAQAAIWCQCLFPDASHCCVQAVSYSHFHLLYNAYKKKIAVANQGTFDITGSRKLRREVHRCRQATALGWRSIDSAKSKMQCWRQGIWNQLYYCSGTHSVCLINIPLSASSETGMFLALLPALAFWSYVQSASEGFKQLSIALEATFRWNVCSQP